MGACSWYIGLKIRLLTKNSYEWTCYRPARQDFNVMLCFADISTRKMSLYFFIFFICMHWKAIRWKRYLYCKTDAAIVGSRSNARVRVHRLRRQARIKLLIILGFDATWRCKLATVVAHMFSYTVVRCSRIGSGPSLPYHSLSTAWFPLSKEQQPRIHKFPSLDPFPDRTEFTVSFCCCFSDCLLNVHEHLCKDQTNMCTKFRNNQVNAFHA